MDSEQVEQLAAGLGVHPLVARLLAARGVAEVDDARDFLRPRLTLLHDPAELPGAAHAAKRIAEAIANDQPIVVYGDYDVDGVTAASILWHTLRTAGADVSTYVPHRLDEGYGLNEQAIASLCDREDGRTPLIISVDCGITATGPAATAKKLGAELIITDHHTFDEDDLPDACALVHPRLARDGEAPYPCPDLCGAGVAFKLAWQAAREHYGSDRVPTPVRELLIDLLSYVALGTVADVVPLTGENRVMTIFGLSRVKHTDFAGLNALIDAARLREDRIEAYHVGFVLGPRLNACGRMGHAREAVRLLTEADGDEAAELANFLTQENDRRRATEREIAGEAEQMVLDRGFDAEDSRAIVVGKEGWHPGVIGIVASRLVERFGRPVIMLNFDNGTAKGSARSVEGVSIHDALCACEKHLSRFGGHAMAAGMTLPTEAVDTFRDDLVAFVNDRLSPEQLVPLLDIDAEITLPECTLELFEQLQQLAPFGRSNPSPRLVLREASLDHAKPIGKQGRHLHLQLRQNGQVLRAVAFGFGELAEELPPGATLDVVFEPKLSTWRGQRRVELHVKDVKRSR